jgi:hypothetical protein
VRSISSSMPATDLVVDAGNGNSPSRSCSAPVWVVDRFPHAAS